MGREKNCPHVAADECEAECKRGARDRASTEHEIARARAHGREQTGVSSSGNAASVHKTTAVHERSVSSCDMRSDADTARMTYELVLAHVV